MISRDETKILAPICKFYSLGHFNESWPMTSHQFWEAYSTVVVTQVDSKSSAAAFKLINYLNYH